jgi:hypothetical protein
MVMVRVAFTRTFNNSLNVMVVSLWHVFLLPFPRRAGGGAAVPDRIPSKV